MDRGLVKGFAGTAPHLECYRRLLHGVNVTSAAG
jgi:hypothetical protein